MTRIATLCVIALTTPVHAQEWSRFRGPNGSGVGLAVRGEEVAWKVKLPATGHSSPVLWGDKLFVTSGDDANGGRIVQCLNAKNGKEVWRRDFPGKKHGMHKDNSFASSTPAVSERHVVLCCAHPGELLVQALDHHGKELWQTGLGPYRAGHGFGASPIVHDDVVAVPNDQDGDSKLVGLELATGKTRWQVPRKSGSQYSSPCVFGQPAQIIFTSYAQGLTSVDARTGKVNWELDVFDKGHVECSIASPLVAGERIIASSGYLGVRQEVVTVQMADGKPRATDPVLHRVDKAAPLVPTPIVKDDLLFVWNDRGVVSCVDLKTGKEHWRERVPGSYYSSPVCAGSRLYCPSREGDLVVVAADRKFALIGTYPLGEGSHSTPALWRGKLLIRTFRQMICFGE